MDWIYLSPHFDDVALSCGGLVWEQARAGSQLSVWTICAGEPPPGAFSPFAESLHARWQTGAGAASQRRQEDIASCDVMGAAYRHFDVLDCIYRRGGMGSVPLYASEQAIFDPIHPADEKLVDDLRRSLSNALPEEAEIVVPLALGGHVDHRLTRRTAERLRRRLWYYPDYPYVVKNQDAVEALRLDGWMTHIHRISPAGLDAWGQAVAAHASQISTFWRNLEGMRSDLSEYYRTSGGVVLWRPPV